MGIGAAESSGSGWGYPEAWGVWSEGNKARILIPLKEHLVPKTLNFRIQPYVSSNVKGQIVDIYINKIYSGNYYLHEGKTYDINVNIPQNVKSNFLLVEFYLPDAISPNKAGDGEDRRKLGIGLLSARLN